MLRNVLIGIAGPSAAGKSTVTKALVAEDPNILRLKLDNYFHDVNGFPRHDGELDWDIPSNLNFERLRVNLRDLVDNKQTKTLHFDKETLERTYKVTKPKPIILVEGFLLFYDSDLRSMFDLKIYLDIPDEHVLKRRVNRSETDRYNYIKNVVIPNYEKYGKMQRQYADYCLDGTMDEDVVKEEIKKLIDDFVKGGKVTPNFDE